MREEGGTGGPYSLTLMIPSAGFAAEGETVLGGLHRDASPHHHCARCKNWLFTTNIGGGQFVNFRPTMLDDAGWVRPLIESWVGEKLPGVQSGAKHAFEALSSARGLWSPDAGVCKRSYQAWRRGLFKPPGQRGGLPSG